MLKRAGRYEIVAELGRGGFGQVYRAFDPTLNSFVAIKTLAIDNDASVLARFRNEAAASRRLRHPNIVTIYDFGEQDGTPFIVMELLEGQDLQRVIDARKPLPLFHKIQIMTQVASGLGHAHAHEIVHRDVKPANVMLLPDGSIKIMDFGIARVSRDTQNRLTPRGAVIGTFRYMAPEQFRGLEQDVRGDIFAYGLMFYELLAGIHPFHAAEPAALMYNILNLEPVPIHEACPGCPESLQPVIARLLQKDPEFRYQSLEDVLFDCEPILSALKRERARELFDEARKALRERQLEAGQALLRQVMELDPTYPGARELREQLQTGLRRLTIRPRIEALTNEAREHLSAGNPTEAVHKFEAAARLDPTDTSLKSSLEQAKAILEASRQAAKLMADAERALNSGDLTGAHRVAKQAVDLAPGDTRVRELFSKTEAALAEQERQHRLAEDLARARRLIEIRSWEDAFTLLLRLEREFPRVDEVRDLRLRLDEERRADERRQRLTAGLTAARQEIHARNLEAARDRLAALRTEFPDSSDVDQLLRFTTSEIETLKHSEFVERSLNAARELVRRSRFSDAARLLQSSLASYPADPVLERELRSVTAAQQQAERDAALSQALNAAKALQTEGRFADAVARLDAFSSAYGRESTVDELRQALEREREAAQRAAELRAMVRRVNELLSGGKAEEATEVLRKPPSVLKDHPEITQLRTVAQRQLDLQMERATALSEALTSAKALREQNDFGPAAQVLAAFTTRYGAEPGVAELAASIKAAREAYQRRVDEQRRAEEQRQAAERRRAEEEQRLAEEQQRRAEEQQRRIDEQRRAEEQQRLAEEQRQRQAEEQRRAEEQQRRAEEQRQRVEELNRLVRRAEGFLAEGKAVEATQLLGSRAGDLKEHPEAARLRDQAALLVRQQADREAAARTAIASSLALEREGRFEDALEALNAFVVQFGPDARIGEREQTVQANREAARRTAEIRELAARARNLLNQEDLQGALTLLQQAPFPTGESYELRELLNTAKARLAAQQTSAAVAAALSEARALLGRSEFRAALNLVDAGLKQYPSAADLQSVRSEIVAAEAAKQLAEFRTWTISQVQSLAAKHEYNQALVVLQDGYVRLPGDEQLRRLGAELESRRQRWEAIQAEEKIQQDLRRAQELLATQPAESVTLLLRLSAQHPDRPDLAPQLSQAQQALQRAEESRLIQEAERLCEQSRFEEALAKLNQTGRETAELRSARQQVETRRAAAENQRIAAAIQVARETAGRDPSQALLPLEKLRQEFPNRPEIAQAVEELRAAVRASELRGAILEIEDLCSKGKLSKARALHRKTVARLGPDAGLDQVLARIEKSSAPKPAPAIEATPQPAKESPQPRRTWVLAASIVGAVAIVGTGVWILTHRSSRTVEQTPVALVPVEIRTDPAGASVRVGDRSCVTPDCRLQLPPGTYPVQTQLQGYESAQQTLTVDAAKPLALLSVTMKPAAAPPPPGAASGTLVVQAGLPDARVIVDNLPRGLTDASGNLSLPLTAKAYRVRVEKLGYETPREVPVTIVDNKSQSVSFNLVPRNATLELRGAPAGVDVRTATSSLGRTDASGVFTATVPPGDQTLQVTEGSSTRQIPQRFEPGQLVALEWANVAPVKSAPPPPPPPKVETKTETKVDVAEQEWDQVRNANDAAQLQAYLDKYPNSPHVAEAQTRIEALVWSRTNQNDAQSLRAYVTRFPRGPHVRDANSRLAELAWNGVDKKDEQAVRKFVEQNSDSPFKAEAEGLIKQLEQQRLEAERLKRDQDKQAGVRQIQTQAIQSLLDQFNAAFKGKRTRELLQIWPGAAKEGKAYVDAMNNPGATFVMELHPTGAPEVNGETATVACNLDSTTTLKGGKPGRNPTKALKVTLRNMGDHWVIVSLGL